MAGVKGRSGVYIRTKPIWNKGIKIWWRSPAVFKKGEHTGEKHWQWRGNNVSYSGLHLWIRRHLGKAIECVYCGANKSEKKIEWASVSHHAKRDLSDYISLCVACHREYDKKGRLQFWTSAPRLV